MKRPASTTGFVDEVALAMPDYDGRESEAVGQVLASGRLEGGGVWLDRCESELRDRFPGWIPLVTTSCTHALELMLMAHGIGPGDEVIVPAFTFTSTATCVLRQGARPVFADSLPNHPNVDPADILRRITPRTRAVITVHYGGVACDLSPIRSHLASRGILEFEDAAHAFGSSWNGKPCGTLGAAACFSFHGTKNITCGEGGALLLRNGDTADVALVGREMGTDRALYRMGRIFRYTWRAAGSSFLPPEISMAILSVQLSKSAEITSRRRACFARYDDALAGLEAEGRLVRPQIDRARMEHNAHIYFVLFPDTATRAACHERMRREGISTAVHYDALDRTPFGRTLCNPDHRPCVNAAAFSDRLLRLPIHSRLDERAQARVVDALTQSLSG